MMFLSIGRVADDVVGGVARLTGPYVDLIGVEATEA